MTDDAAVADALDPPPDPVPAHETTRAAWSAANPWFGAAVTYSHEVQW